MTKILILALESRETGIPDAEADGAPSLLGAVPWAVLSDGAVTASGRLDGPATIGTLLTDHPGFDRVVVLVPGTDVLIRLAAVPAKRDAEARVAAPFLLEDDLAVDPEDVHVALGPADEDGRRLIAVVAHERMRAWRDALEPLAAAELALVPEGLAVPAPEKGVALYTREDRILLRRADGSAATVDRALAGVVLPALLAETDGAVEVHGDALVDLPSDSLAGRDIREKPALDATGFLTRCGTTPVPVNLFQGPYGRRGRWSFEPRLWLRSGAIAACLLLAVGAVALSRAVRMDQKAEFLHTQTERLFRETFPDVRRVVNPRAQMNARLKAVSVDGADPFLALTGLLFRSLRDLPAVEIRDLRFYEERGELGVSVAYRDYGDLERLKALIDGKGGRFAEGGSRQQGDRIVGEVTVGMR